MKRAERKGRAPTGGDPANDIERLHPALDHGMRTGFALVFGTFHRAIERPDAARHDGLHQFGIGSKGGRDFAGVEHPEPPAGARAHVE